MLIRVKGPRKAALSLLGALALGLSVASLAAGALAQLDPDEDAAPFTSQERQRLRAGELVARHAVRREGPYRYLGGTSWQRVRAPVEEVWEKVLDVDAYPRLIPSLASATVVSDRGDARVMRMEHRYSVASASYFANVQIDREHHALRFDLDRSRPHDLRAGRGFLTLSDYHGDTIVTWGALADMGGGMAMEVFGPMVREWVLMVPRCVRDAMEIPGGGC